MPDASGSIGGPSGIGDMAIGGVPFNGSSTRISQYATSPHVVGILESFGNSLYQGDNLDTFFNFVWNVQTAVGYGLDVWGRIVVINRTLTVNTRFFGFEEGLPDFDPFNTSPFYTGQRIGNAFVLSDEGYRLLILAKALANITYGSIPGINGILQLLFPERGPCYVTDNQDMTMTYTFGFALTPVELAIVQTSNVLPRPTGVRIIFDIGG